MTQFNTIREAAVALATALQEKFSSHGFHHTLVHFGGYGDSGEETNREYQLTDQLPESSVDRWAVRSVCREGSPLSETFLTDRSGQVMYIPETEPWEPLGASITALYGIHHYTSHEEAVAEMAEILGG